MKIKKNTNLIFIIISILTFLYIILAAHPLKPEFHFVPEWTKDITASEFSTISKDEPVTFFKLGQNAGYFTSEGEIVNSISFPSKIAISENNYALYSTDATDIPFYDIYGNKKGELNTSGYPYFYDNRYYVFLPGGSSFSLFNEKGNLMWTNESVMPVTAFASNKTFTASGYADGTIRIIDNNYGTTITEFAPGGSESPIILGLDVSVNGEYTACISGHNKQRFILTQTLDNRQKVIYHKYLETDLRARTLVKILKDNSKVIYVYENNVGIYDIKNKRNSDLNINDNIISIEETSNLIYLLGKNGKTYTVYIIEKSDDLLGKFSFEAETACIQTLNDNLYIGKDNYLSKIAVKKD